jgi:tripartite-type tricarboxylate transporter receptor subunit TctC
LNRSNSPLKLLSFTALLAALLGAGAVLAQAYPAKSVRILTGSPRGGMPDSLARGIAQELGRLWGQSVVVENRSGGNGVVAATAAATSAPDGYTMLLSSIPSMNAAQFLRRNLRYDPAKDFVPVAGLAQSRSLLVANPELPVQSLADLIALARAKPGLVKYGSFGVASTSQLDSEALGRTAGVRFTHVPYKGSLPITQALRAGQIDFALLGLSAEIPPLVRRGKPRGRAYVNEALELVRQGELKGLAYGGERRLKLLPEVPTLAELGYKMETGGAFGLWVPAGTAPGIIAKIAADTARARSGPAFEKVLMTNGFDELALEGAAFVQRVRESRDDYANRIVTLDIKRD